VDAIATSGQRTAAVAVSETVVLLSGPPDAGARREMEDLAVAICDRARKRGWKACAGWKDESVKVRLQNGEAESVGEFLQSFAARAEKSGAKMSMREEETASPSICALEDAPIMWGTVVQARLTRDLLCGLPEGAFVASASDEDRVHSVGRLGPFHVRAQQWQWAQLSGLDGGMCRVFWSEDDYNAFVRSN
jgi:hypothetical protein